MSISIGDSERTALEAYSRGDIAALDLRRRLNNATFGEILELLSAEQLPLPRAPQAGREGQLTRAQQWLFPKHDD